MPEAARWLAAGAMAALLCAPGLQARAQTPQAGNQPSDIILPPLPPVTVTLPKPAKAQIVHLDYGTPASPAPRPAVPAVSAAPSVPASPPVAVTPTPVAPANPPADPALVAALAALPSPRQPQGNASFARTYGNFRQAVTQQYALTADQPIFMTSGVAANAQWSPAAQSLAHRLLLAAHDGINLAQTPVPAMNATPTGAADVALTAAVLNYAWQAQGGRVNPAYISRFVELRPVILPPATVIASVLAAQSAAGQTLAQLNPRHAGYQWLRTRLIGLLDHRPSADPVGPNRFAPKRRNLVDLALRRWRAERNSLVVNMEFWRWQQPARGSAQIVVNVPEFTLRLRQDGHTLLARKVIVGKQATPTPLLNSNIKYIIINPSWHVPQSIIKKDFIPKLQANPDYLASRGFDVRVSHGQLIVKQPPGPHNALGLIKFIFPNDQSVYLHDTSERRLFSSRTRAFSHGCVRLQEPFSLAAALLGSSWPQKRLKSMVGSKEHYLRFKQDIPIQIEYFTLHANREGKLAQFADLYGYARKVQTALGLKT